MKEAFQQQRTTPTATKFFTTHAGILQQMATPQGTVIGHFTSNLNENPDTTHFPCFAGWQPSQVYETTPYVQQCVYTAVRFVPKLQNIRQFYGVLFQMSKITNVKKKKILLGI